MTLQVDMIDAVETFERLEPEWNALVRDTGNDNVFLTWAWMSVWLESESSSGRLRVLTVRDGVDGTLLGVAPLFLRRLPRGVGLLRELSLVGAGPASGDHLEFLLRPGHEDRVLDRLLHAVRDLAWDVLRLDGLRGDSSLVEALAGVAAGRGHLSATGCPYLRLPRSWQALERSLPRKLRYNLRSRARRLDRDAGGEVEYVTVRREDEIASAMEALRSLKREAGEYGGRRNHFDTAQRVRFHERLARRFLREGWLRLYLLRVRGRVIAASYCYRYGKTLSFFQTGFDREWARYGPGAAITAFSIREAIREGAEEFDFLRGNEPYKFQWASGSRSVLKLRIGATMLGKLSVSGYKLARDARNRLLAARVDRRRPLAPSRVAGP